jgi:histidinol-phosphate aminotransferase
MAHRYPSTDHKGLRTALSEITVSTPSGSSAGSGRTRSSRFCARPMPGRGTRCSIPSTGSGCTASRAWRRGDAGHRAEKERVVDIEAILDAVTERTRLIFIANPANPTGTMLPLSAFEDLAARLPEQCLLVLDGAYAEFAEGL